MPKEITHCLFAERSMQLMASSRSLSRRDAGRELMYKFTKNPEALYFGSVSPDIFYYDLPLPGEKRNTPGGAVWGDLIHGAHGEDSLKHVREMLEILNDRNLQAPLRPGRPLNDEEQGILQLFIMGYLAHVAMDTLLHPVVYYFSGNYYADDPAQKRRAEARHRAIETVYDLYNLQRAGTTVKGYRMVRRISLSGANRDLILGLYTLALLRAWPELAAREFGSAELPQSAREHPLFRIATRSYRKQLFFNRLFSNRYVARLGFWWNNRKNDALHFNSSLLYPAQSYAEYTSASRSHLRIEDLRTYLDPIDRREKHFDPRRIEQRVLERTAGFYYAVARYTAGPHGDARAARVFRGFSLNNGRVGIATHAMKYFSPLEIDGNFCYTKRTG